MLVFYLAALSTWTLSEAVTIDYLPVTYGIEVSLKDWLGETRLPLKMEKPRMQSVDLQCNLVVSAVKATLFMKKLRKVLTEEEVARALDHFDSCWINMCRNSALINKFGDPTTYKEQIDILIATAKMPKWEKQKAHGKILRYLVDSKYGDIYRSTFPPMLTKDSLPHDKKVAADVIESICFGRPNEAEMDQADVAKISYYALVDRYTSDSVKEMNISQFTSSSKPEEWWDMWKKTAEKIFAPTSNFATSCLDPAIAFYDHDRPSVMRIKEFATKSLGIDCGLNDRGAPVILESSFATAFIGAAPSSSFEKSGPPSDSGPSGSGGGLNDRGTPVILEFSFATASLGAAPSSSFEKSGPPSDSGPSGSSGAPSFGGGTGGGPPAGR